jgi:secondary thiamine-phosphate synthase enzyme
MRYLVLQTDVAAIAMNAVAVGLIVLSASLVMASCCSRSLSLRGLGPGMSLDVLAAWRSLFRRGTSIRCFHCCEASMTSAKSISLTPPSHVSASSVVSSMLTVQTSGAGFIDLTREVAKFIAEAGALEGVLTLFIRHTSASLTIQENADPSVLVDLMTILDRLAPQDFGWTHDTEGPDDMPAHVRTMLTASSLQVPVLSGQLALGTWQAIYLIEHRSRPHRREVVLQFLGATS